jgi:FMN-dependent NADH-azoreductase
MATRPKTLLVEYAPRKEKSRTRQLRQYFTDMIKDHTDITTLDMSCEMPDLLNCDAVQAYYKRNYEKQELTKEESQYLAKMDYMRDQLLETDVLIMSSPMYNFGYPAPMKGWIDSVMQKGYAYDTDEHGHIPKLKRLQALFIYTSGIVYDQISENEDWNGLLASGPRLFEYMGAHVRVVQVEGVDMLDPKFVEFRTKNVANEKLKQLAVDWYGVKLPEPIKKL